MSIHRNLPIEEVRNISTLILMLNYCLSLNEQVKLQFKLRKRAELVTP